MHRFYAEQNLSDESIFTLNQEDSHHALRVLRMHSGDKAEVFYQNQRYLAVLESAGENTVRFRPLHILSSTEPKIRATLFQGLPKGDKMDWIVQKSVELGVSRIVPVAFSRCITKLSSSEAEKKRERWQKIAREAGKQSGRCMIPEVCLPVSLSAVPDLIQTCDYTAVPWEECPEGGPLSFTRRHPSLSTLGVVIGPEGGISAEELSLLQQKGCEPITLGKRILRTETAGIAALSAFFGLYGEMEL